MRIILTLDRPPSGNLAARHTTGGIHFKPKKVTDYFKHVADIARIAGIKEPLQGRYSLTCIYYPARPKDWQKRAKKSPLWADTIRRLDNGNIPKVLEDALNKVVVADDRMNHRLLGLVAEPDDIGERVIVIVQPITIESVQFEIDSLLCP